MKLGHIRNIEIGRIPDMGNFQKDIIFGEHITQEKMKQIAKSISDEILSTRSKGLQPSIQEHIVLSLLEPSHMFSIINSMSVPGTHDDIQSVTEDELKNFLEKIRAFIVEEIKKTADLNDPLFHFISKTHPKKKNIAYLEQGGVRKDNRYGSHPEFIAKNTIALEKLYALKDRSPYILYGLTHKDPGSGDEIQTYHDIEILEQYKKSGNSPLPAFCALRDAVRGAKFLSDNGLIITDLSDDNIAVNKQQRTGYLFDFDGLISKGEKMPFYAAKTSQTAYHNLYCPPEWFKGVDTANEGFSLYELGATLVEIINYASFTPFKSDKHIATIFASFARLARVMLEMDPSRRVTLETAEIKLTDFCQRLEIALQQYTPQPLPTNP